ncbi:uncharacterized protein LOC132853799 [Tachysurus vachellii]|uniref:uncharacterized protein LOC132853799 n=1 Tax=Tachysurus vachellii TaxID=175792 RepID=UPI00296AD42A|nr:uncharacterized protein LOC132853799 [Tachysurus vachellii]
MMLCLKLTLLTLLIAAPGLHVSGESVITCDGDVQRLTCDSGVIKVTSTVYGRSDSQICSAPHPNLKVTDTSCSSTVSTIADRCNGLRECEVKTDLLGSSDPCKGTYKYYTTTYDCIDAHVAVVCEHGYRTLDCGADTIEIVNANFGRADSVTCSSGIPNGLTQNTNCYSPNALSSVASLCNGKNSCTVEASSTIFTDPCKPTAKYLTVSYTCITNQRAEPVVQHFNTSNSIYIQHYCFNTFSIMMLCLKLTLLTLLIAAPGLHVSGESVITCDGDVQRLTCDSGVIKVTSTVYGRSDSKICSAPHPNLEVTDTSCSSTVSTIADRCNGLRECEVKTNLLGSSDPCKGTYKYYTTTYDCIDAHVAVVCEHGYRTLDCGADTIEIVNANFGRADSVTCSSGIHNGLTQNTNCYSPNALSSVASLCNGKNSCTVEASSTIFTDPCKPTAKYLTVSYTCITNQRSVPVVQHFNTSHSIYIQQYCFNTFSIMMLCLKLTLLTLLIAAPGLHVSGESVITCDGDVQRLTCDSGVIKVTSTVYGRSDSQICSAPHPNLKVTDTSCSSTVSTIADRCNGLRECEVKTDLLGSSDPCKGTYKYYTTTYDCIDAHVAVACEHGYRTLDCGADTIEIVNANFGRADSVTCSSGVPNGLTQNTNCYSPKALSTVASLCNGKNSCTVEASSTIFTDPCKPTAKYLTVSYTCIANHRKFYVFKFDHYIQVTLPGKWFESNEGEFAGLQKSGESNKTLHDKLYIRRSVPVVQHFNTSHSIYIQQYCFNTFSIMMLCLKLTLLTLLIAAPGLHVSGESVITCDGDVQRLTCDSGVIKVTSTVYGRSDSQICSAPHPNLEVTDTSCSSTVSTIADRCNGLRECEVKTDLLGSSDPCKGTYKYYTTTYDCIDAHVAVVCQHGYRTLDCGADTIEIVNANFGRADSVTCSSGVPNGLTQNTNCYSPNALSTVASLCNGKNSCTVEASSTIFTDPCKPTAKYLTVSYTCIANQIE